MKNSLFNPEWDAAYFVGDKTTKICKRQILSTF